MGEPDKNTVASSLILRILDASMLKKKSKFDLAQGNRSPP